MRSLILLLSLVLLVSSSVLRHDDTRHRHRRELKGELHDWLTAEQKTELENLSHDSEEFKTKVMKFYSQLPDEKQKEWNEFYKNKVCFKWVKKVATGEEEEQLEGLYAEKKYEDAEKLLNEWKDRLDEKEKKEVEQWKDGCNKLKRETRKRRAIDSNFEDFGKWLTPEQLAEIEKLKADGKSFDEIREKTSEYFFKLPAEKQTELKEQWKGKCKAYFTPLLTEEEINKLKGLVEAGNQGEAKTIMVGVVGRQEGATKEIAGKMQAICADVFSPPKSKRDVKSKIEKHLAWLTPEQKKEIESLTLGGADKSEISKKLFEFINEKEKDPQSKADAVKKCYKWMESVATKEEIDSLHKLHEVDHNACKTKVREFISRLPVDERAAVEENLPVCEKLWYGSHDHHGHHGHHHRRRRHLSVIDKYLDWLTDSQKIALKEMEDGGADFEHVVEKIKEFYKELPEDKKSEVRVSFKETCQQMAKDVSKPGEWDELKKLHTAKEHKKLREKLYVLEGRLTENQKHTIEHVRDVCYKLWDIDTSSRRLRSAIHDAVDNYEHHHRRLRRDHHHKDLESALKAYLTWLTPEQVEELKKLNTDGKKEEIYTKVLTYFDAATGETRETAQKELQHACRSYTKEVIGNEKAEELKKLHDSGVSKEDMAKKVQEIVDNIDDAEKKQKALKIVAACKKVYGVSRRRRSHHEHTLDEWIEKYLTWLTPEQVEEVKKLYGEGKKEDVYRKIDKYYDETSGDTQVKATQELISGCKHFIGGAIGEVNSNTIKELKQSGASIETIKAKAEEFISQITDEATRTRTQKAAAACKKYFEKGAANKRVKRDLHEHTLEEDAPKYLGWLSQQQWNELYKTAVDTDNTKAVYEKIAQLYDRLPEQSPAKKIASNSLILGCKHLISTAIGPEATQELNEMKESGASTTELRITIVQNIRKIEDEEARAEVLYIARECEQYFSTARARFTRKPSVQGTINMMRGFLKHNENWLTQEHKDMLYPYRFARNQTNLIKKYLQILRSESDETVAKLASQTTLKTCRNMLVQCLTKDSYEMPATDDIQSVVHDKITRNFESCESPEIQVLAPICHEARRILHKMKTNHWKPTKDARLLVYKYDSRKWDSEEKGIEL